LFAPGASPVGVKVGQILPGHLAKITTQDGQLLLERTAGLRSRHTPPCCPQTR
jgi:hypothetical protein